MHVKVTLGGNEFEAEGQPESFWPLFEQWLRAQGLGLGDLADKLDTQTEKLRTAVATSSPLTQQGEANGE